MPTTAWPACDEPVGSRAVSDGPERMERLERENEQLRHAIESRPVIDLARGALMATFGCQAQAAWEILVEVSQNSNVKLRVVADVVTAAVTGSEPLPPDLQNHLQTAVERWRSREHEPGAGG
ncbi:ANTAR domain-containing protein [Streptomyces mirabilis]|uniref:ANTAR domain-containing protein n=1 Tax=Streptomyces mirabilis TaxID=68239 RepID=UPI002E2E013A|nr:ANTAR domain-containing protein [Streptomyces mirabilis]